MLTLFLEMAKNVLVLSSSLWTLPDLNKLQKFFQWQGFHSVESTHKFLVSIYIVVGLKLFATNVVVKHMPIALTNIVIVSVGKDAKVFSQKLHGQAFCLSLVLYLCASPDSSSSQTSGHSSCREDVGILGSRIPFFFSKPSNNCRTSTYLRTGTNTCKTTEMSSYFGLDQTAS